MAVHATTVEVEARADLTLWVRRGEAGGVTTGVRTVLDAVDGVEAVTVHEVTGVRPMANELRLDATVEVTLRVERAFESREGAIRRLLADGFGVTEVREVTLDLDQ